MIDVEEVLGEMSSLVLVDVKVEEVEVVVAISAIVDDRSGIDEYVYIVILSLDTSSRNILLLLLLRC